MRGPRAMCPKAEALTRARAQSRAVRMRTSDSRRWRIGKLSAAGSNRQRRENPFTGKEGRWNECTRRQRTSQRNGEPRQMRFAERAARDALRRAIVAAVLRMVAVHRAGVAWLRVGACARGVDALRGRRIQHDRRGHGRHGLQRQPHRHQQRKPRSHRLHQQNQGYH
jgi:hypothetical protein